MILKLWPLALGVAAAWLIVRWRDARALVGSARTAPAVPGRDWGAPAAAGSIYESPPMYQFPGSFDEFSSQPVNAGGDVPTEQSVVAPNELATVTLVDDPPLALRDTVSAMPVAAIGDEPEVPVARRPILGLPPLRDIGDILRPPPDVWTIPRQPAPRPAPPRLQPDHNFPVPVGTDPRTGYNPAGGNTRAELAAELAQRQARGYSGEKFLEKHPKFARAIVGGKR